MDYFRGLTMFSFTQIMFLWVINLVPAMRIKVFAKSLLLLSKDSYSEMKYLIGKPISKKYLLQV